MHRTGEKELHTKGPIMAKVQFLTDLRSVNLTDGIQSLRTREDTRTVPISGHMVLCR